MAKIWNRSEWTMTNGRNSSPLPCVVPPSANLTGRVSPRLPPGWVIWILQSFSKCKSYCFIGIPALTGWISTPAPRHLLSNFSATPLRDVFRHIIQIFLKAKSTPAKIRIFNSTLADFRMYQLRRPQGRGACVNKQTHFRYPHVGNEKHLSLGDVAYKE